MLFRVKLPFNLLYFRNSNSIQPRHEMEVASKTMHIGEVVRLWGNSGTIDFCNPINQSWVFAQKSNDDITEVFTYTAWRPGAIHAEKVPLFEIGIRCAVPEPYVLFTTTTNVDYAPTPSLVWYMDTRQEGVLCLAQQF